MNESNERILKRIERNNLLAYVREWGKCCRANCFLAALVLEDVIKDRLTNLGGISGEW